MQEDFRNLPGLVDIFDNPMIKKFIENGTVPDQSYFLGQLDVVDNAACSWLTLLKGISLNVFKVIFEVDSTTYFQDGHIN